MKRVEQALSTFRQAPKMYNCAQTVCAAFGCEHLVEAMSQCGGGKAPDGTCGALYGAMQVAPERAEELKAAFEQMHGSTKCQQLKKEHHVPCQSCVRSAATLLVQGVQAKQA